MSWLFCAVWDLSEPVTSLNMWRRNGRVSLVGGTDLLCATFLETPHLALLCTLCRSSRRLQPDSLPITAALHRSARWQSV